MMKIYHVEYDLSVPDYATWSDDHEVDYKRIDPGPSKPFIYVPMDANITEVVADGIYVYGSANILYKKFKGQWYIWDDTNTWVTFDAINDNSFVHQLRRIDG
jgi:hypothetical protein